MSQTLPVRWTTERESRLAEELRYACSRASSDELLGWARDSGAMLGKVTLRRAVRLGKSVLSLIWATVEEAIDAAKETAEGRAVEHLKGRGGAALKAAQEAYDSGRRDLDGLINALRDRPAETAPRLAVAVLAAVATSGGPDGDGGTPDLDLALGIDAHRSIFTHSVFAGAIIETGLYSIARLIDIVYRRLPEAHDPFWDAFLQHKSAFLEAASKGASFGIAYHLLVDATVQPAPYHDLPVAAPIEVHQGILAANAAAEALDASRKREEFYRTPATTDAARTAPPLSPPRASLPSASSSVEKAALPAPAPMPELDLVVDADTSIEGDATTDNFYLSRKLSRLRPEVEAALSVAEAEVLRRIGIWLNALATGRLEPRGRLQRHFLWVTKDHVAPKTDIERLWVKYRSLTERAAAPERVR